MLSDLGPASGSHSSRRGSDTGETPQPSGDAEVLDAYSRAVVDVVEAIRPALLAIRGPRGSRRSDESRGSGSGFLMTHDGYAITNSHVVAGRSRLAATIEEGDTFDVDVIGDDAATDLALVRVAARDLPVATFGDSDALRVGQLVIAMGSPFGLQSTVSSGIVSALGRGMRGAGGRLIEGVVQHTAPINPGNSGGPLLDARGRVVGVNTAMIAFAQGVGLAIPSNTARWVLTELITHGRVRRMTLGVAGQVVVIPRRVARELDLLNETGVRVASIEDAGAAARGGLRESDVIVALDGRLVATIDDLHRLLARHDAQRSTTLTVLRGDRCVEITIDGRSARSG